MTLLLAQSAMPFCYVPHPRLVCAEYYASKAVVKATLVQTHAIHDNNEPEAVIANSYQLQVISVLRGDVGEAVRVYEGNDSERATFRWIKGRTYLLFLSYSPTDKAWGLDGCVNSGPLNASRVALAKIEAIKRHPDRGIIQRIVSENSLSSVLPGVGVEARGKDGLHSTKTNDMGAFQMRVPIGRYELHATQNGFSFNKADISYEDPNNIRIEAGGCAQVQLTRTEKQDAYR
jgi:hypothetical protein